MASTMLTSIYKGSLRAASRLGLATRVQFPELTRRWKDSKIVPTHTSILWHAHATLNRYRAHKHNIVKF